MIASLKGITQLVTPLVTVNRVPHRQPGQYFVTVYSVSQAVQVPVRRFSLYKDHT